MKKSLERDLADASDAIETILKKYVSMTMHEKVDCAARLRAVSKNIEAFDKDVKGEIKKQLKEKPGTVLGEVFKAVCSLVEVTRFNQGAFKEQSPEVFDSYCELKSEPRVSFEAR